MCDLHNKRLEYYCLHHDILCCRKCKLKLHDNERCECLHVRDVYDRLQLEMEEKRQDLIQLREGSMRILDGSYQRNLLNRVNDEEAHLDQFYKDMKKKFKETKQKIKSFTSEELSETLRDHLQASASEQIPAKFERSDKPQDMQHQLKSAKRQIQAVNNLMYSLPNYIEIVVDKQFMKLLTYSADPIVIKGRPMYITQVSTDDDVEISSTDDDDDGDIDDIEHADQETTATQNRKRDETRLQRRTLRNGKDKPTKSAPDQVRDMKFNKDATDNDSSVNGVIRWFNNSPAFTSSANQAKADYGVTDLTKTTKPTFLNKRLPNKYEQQIEEAKKRLTMPAIPRTPETVRNIRERNVKKNSSRSMPDDVLTDKPTKKLFLSHTKTSKYKVKERVLLDGCEDAIVLKDCIILSLGDKLQKLDRKSLKLSIEMKLTNCSELCAISHSPVHLAVIQLRKCITIIDTQFGLSVVYKINIKQDYLSFCNIGITEDGPRHPSYVFAAIYKEFANKPVNCLDIIQAKPTRRPGRPPVFDAQATEVMLPGSRPNVISGIGGFSDGHIVLGLKEAVVCITMEGKLAWRTAVPREVSGILCTKSYIYTCIQDERRVVTFNKCGFVTDENVIPDLDIIPCKLSANWDIMLLKDFKTKTWISITFKHGLFIV